LMLVPNPQLIDAAIRAIPKGQHVAIADLRSQLAAQHKADVTCPITVGFHLRTVAEAAFEQVQQGKAWAEVTPFWRVIDAKSPTLKRLSFDPAVVLRMRQAEGLAGSPAATAAASNCPHLK
jgi:hypothetical protein